MRIFLLLFISISASAYNDVYIPKNYKPKIGECFMSYNLNCRITQKLDKNLYGLACDSPMVEDNAIVKLIHPPTYPITGRLSMTMKRVKTGRAELTNGFEVNFDYFEPCDGKTIKGFPGGNNG